MTSRSEYLAKLASRVLNDDAEDDSSFDGDDNNNCGASLSKSNSASSHKDKPSREPLSPLSANRGKPPQPQKLWDDYDDADKAHKHEAASVAKLKPSGIFRGQTSRVSSCSSSGLAKRAASFMHSNLHRRYGSHGNLKQWMDEAGELALSSRECDEVEYYSTKKQHGLSVHDRSSSVGIGRQAPAIGAVDRGEGLPPKAVLQKNKSTETKTDLQQGSHRPIPRHRRFASASSSFAEAAMITPAASKPRNSLELQLRRRPGQLHSTNSTVPSPSKPQDHSHAQVQSQSRRHHSNGKPSLTAFMTKSSSFSSCEGDAHPPETSSAGDQDDAVSSIFDGLTINSSGSGGSGSSRNSSASGLSGRRGRSLNSRDAVHGVTSRREVISRSSAVEGIEAFIAKDSANVTTGNTRCIGDDGNGESIGSNHRKKGSVASGRRKELNRLKRFSNLNVGVLGLTASGSTESQETEASRNSPASKETIDKIGSFGMVEPAASAGKASLVHARHRRARSLATLARGADDTKRGNVNDGMESRGRQESSSSSLKSSLMNASKPTASSNNVVVNTEPLPVADHVASEETILRHASDRGAKSHIPSSREGKLSLTPSNEEETTSDVVRDETPISRGRSGFNRSRHHFRSTSLSRGSATTPPRPGRTDSGAAFLQTANVAFVPSVDAAAKRFERRRSRSRSRHDCPPGLLPSVSPHQRSSSLTTASGAVVHGAKGGECDRLRNRRKASIRNLSPPPPSLQMTTKSPIKSPLLESGQAYLRRTRRGSKSSLSPPPRSLSYSSNVDAISKSGSTALRSNSRVVTKLKSKKQAFLPIARLSTAVIPMQCLARCYLARRHIEKRCLSILQIQSCIRMWACQRHYRSIKMHCVRMQSRFRGNLTREALLHRHRSAVQIQRIVRGYLTFIRFIEDMGNIILIQSLVRRKIQEAKYEDYCWAASTIQFWYRMKKHEELVNLDFLWDVVVAQSAVRRWLAKRRAKEIHCVKIQSAWRMFVCKSDFAFTVIDITLVQSKVRRWLALRRADELRQRVEAATVIQSAIRGRNVYLDYLWTICSIILCQSIVRRFISIQHTNRLKELRKNTAALTIQCAYRRHVAMSDYIFFLSDVILCQSIVRRFQSIKLARRMTSDIHRRHNEAAALIQSTFRRHTAMNQYAFFLSDIILCQSIVRRFLSIQLVRRKNIETQQRRNAAAVVIQSAFRKHLIMSDYIFTVSDIILCQSIARRFLSVQRARELKSHLGQRNAAATIIQSYFRRYLSSTNYAFTQANIISCQSIWRRRLAIRKLKGMRRVAAATIIQSTFRKHITMSNYIFTLSDIIICQSVWRRKLAMMQVDVMRRNVAATTIQSTFRRHISMSTYFFTLLDIIICQSVCRRYLAIRKAEYKAKERISAVVIQTLVRRWISNKILEEKKLRKAIRIEQMNQASVSIQKIVRGRIAYFDFVLTMVSIITCQSSVRRWRSKRELNELRTQKRENAAVKIQAIYRGFSSMKSFVITLCKVITVQTALRGWISRRELNFLKEEKYRVENEAIIKLQKVFRGYSCSLNYSLTLFSVVELQRVVRGFLAREKYIMDLADVILVQSVVRRNLATKKAKKFRIVQKLASTAISSAWRGFVARYNSVIMISGFTLLQATARGCEVRRQRQREHMAATNIQRVYRGFVTYNSYILDCASVILCQAGARKWLAMKDAAKRRHEKSQQAVVIIQSAWRRFLAESDYIIAQSGCVLLQSFVRRCRASKQYKVLQRTRKNAASRIQNAYRSRLYFNRYIDSLIDIIRCQSHVRKYLAMKKLDQLQRIKADTAATCIQAAFRGYSSHMDFVLTICDVIICQSTARRWLARRAILHRLQEKEIEHYCATKIQVRWRSYVQDRRRFIIVYTGLTVFQSLVRGMIERKRMAHIRSSRVLEESNTIMRNESMATIVLQRWWRSKVAKQIRVQTVAATSIQSCYRGFRAYQNYVTLLYVILKIQGLARGHLCRVQLKQKRAHITKKVASTKMGKKQSVITRSTSSPLRKHVPAFEDINKKRRKAAALVIERFFISIKAEIDREIQKLLEQEESQQKQSSKWHKNSKGRKPNVMRKVTKREVDNPDYSPDGRRSNEAQNAWRFSVDSLTPHFNRLPTPDNSNATSARFANHPPNYEGNTDILNVQNRVANPFPHNASSAKLICSPPRPNLGIMRSSSFAARMLPGDGNEISQKTHDAATQSSAHRDLTQNWQTNSEYCTEHSSQQSLKSHTFAPKETLNINRSYSAQMQTQDYTADYQQKWISDVNAPNATIIRHEQKGFHTPVHHFNERAHDSNVSKHSISNSNHKQSIHAIYSHHSNVSIPSTSIPRDDPTTLEWKSILPEPSGQVFFRPMSQNSSTEYVQNAKSSSMLPSGRREHLSVQPPASSGPNRSNNISYSLPRPQPQSQVQVIPERNSAHSNFTTRQHIMHSPSPSNNHMITPVHRQSINIPGNNNYCYPHNQHHFVSGRQNQLHQQNNLHQHPKLRLTRSYNRDA